MIRKNHVFLFSAEAISKAARAEAVYHLTRVKWWKVEQEKAIAKAKAAGIEIREHDITDGKTVQVVVDPSITDRLSQCATKLAKHRAAADRFEVEADAYGTQPAQSVFELDPDDVVYFRMTGGRRGD